MALHKAQGEAGRQLCGGGRRRKGLPERMRAAYRVDVEGGTSTRSLQGRGIGYTSTFYSRLTFDLIHLAIVYIDFYTGAGSERTIIVIKFYTF